MRAQEVAGGRPRAERVDELEHVVGKLAGAVGSCQAFASPLPPSHTPGGSAGRERTTAIPAPASRGLRGLSESQRRLVELTPRTPAGSSDGPVTRDCGSSLDFLNAEAETRTVRPGRAPSSWGARGLRPQSGLRAPRNHCCRRARRALANILPTLS
jgi:hypothetical protein